MASELKDDQGGGHWLLAEQLLLLGRTVYFFAFLRMDHLNGKGHPYTKGAFSVSLPRLIIACTPVFHEYYLLFWIPKHLKAHVLFSSFLLFWNLEAIALPFQCNKL